MEQIERRALPDWSAADLVAALGSTPVALFEGLLWEGRRCSLVAWAPESRASSIAAAQQAAEAGDLPAGAPPLLRAAVGRLDWDSTGHFWVPGSAALFDPEGQQLWSRGTLPKVVQGQAGKASGTGDGEESSPQGGAKAGPQPLARPLWAKADYTAAVHQVLAAMADGQLVKAILSIPFVVPSAMSPLQVYLRLTAGDPPGLRFMLDDGPANGALIGLSPEPLVHLTGRRAEMHLLAGTRPAGEAYEQDLRTNPKDQEEHAVAVEQARRDLLEVCRPESVLIDRFMELEHHPGLVHLSSHLAGEMRPDASPADLVTACFPAGTVGGIPRAESMALINRLEPIPRGWYAGSIGVVMPGGDLQLWLTIRSLHLKDGEACVRTGAGLVPGSQPEAEWQECLNKARRALAAVGAYALTD